MIRVTIPKNAKSFLGAVKIVASLIKHAVLVCDPDQGLHLENITDERTGYVILKLSTKDAVFERVGDVPNVRWGIDLKQFAGTLRAITTQTDALVIEFTSAHMRVIAKTKKEETTHDLSVLEVSAEQLEIPHGLKRVCNKEMNCKDLEGYIKGAEQERVRITPSDLGESCAELQTQRFQRDTLLHMIKPTLFKTVQITIYEQYPIQFTYKLFKDSKLELYLAESN